MSIKRIAVLSLALGALLTIAGEASAQASFTPSYNAPYRAFESHEFGATLSFPSNTNFGLEGQYRFGRDKYDIGLRGGVVDFEGGSDVVLGIEGRLRVLDHTENDFPLDGAVVVGVGTADFDEWAIPSAGLSLGRRVVLEDFEFVAYGQPTLFLITGGGSTDFDFGLGLGIDFKVGESLDLRTSAGTIDGPEGVSFSLVWVR